jgi:indolepyruvate ferredoxin oxidoreductase beta subunit
MLSDRKAGGSRRPISVAIAALGGQGGGVLSDWLVAVADLEGWLVQSTSVPGVAQRTGTTVYYIELAPRPPPGGSAPVMALMPTPGDVDLVVAAELMEAGRAIVRGFVTPDRTTLIASSHRVYGITEKSALGNGMADTSAVFAAAHAEARRLVCFDMDALATAEQTVISAVLLGAIAGAGGLPFARASYERAIRESGISVRGSLAGFAAGFKHALGGVAAATAAPAATPFPTSAAGKDFDARVRQRFPAQLHPLVVEGVRRLMDYQDAAYAGLYLDRLDAIMQLDAAFAVGVHEFRLTAAVARYLALWMGYEDTIRIADLKTRSGRLPRIRGDVHAADDQLVTVTEFMHPRFQELCETLPAGLGARLLGSRAARHLLRPLFARGRHVSTTRLRGFLPLYLLAGLKRFRRGTLRYRLEQERIEGWLDAVVQATGRDYALGVEVAECGRLIKGYGDTHERGVRNFATILHRIGTWHPGTGLAERVRTLRSAALADEDGRAFAAVLAEAGAD